MAERARLSVLIPVRAEDAAFALDRLGLRDAMATQGVEIILTDDGSPPAVAEAFAAFCGERGWVYQRLDTAEQPFSLARARNAGRQRASGDWLYFDDLDMAYPSDHYARLLVETELLAATPLSFASLPTLYLTADSSARVAASGSLDPHKDALLAQLLFEDPRGRATNRAIDHYAPASAILLVARATVEAVGGYDEEFVGWGGEDRDLVFRLLAANARLPRPDDFAATRRENLNDVHAFAGWRALFRLHGDYLSRKGLYGFHLHHAPNAWRGDRSNIERAAHQARSHTGAAIGTASDADGLRYTTLFSPYASDPGERAKQSGRRGGAGARWRKLRHDPHAYFRDAGFPGSGLLARLFPPRTDVVD